MEKAKAQHQSRSKTMDQLLTDLQKRYAWLAGIPTSIDEWAANQLTGWVPGLQDFVPLDWLQVERNLKRATSMVDKVFVRRNDIQELTAKAIFRALEYKRFSDSTAYERELALLSTGEDQSALISAGNKSAAAAFKVASGSDAIAAGFESQAGATAAVADLSVGVETRKKKLVNAKMDVLDQYEADLEAAHTQNYSALNYSERIQRLSTLYLDDLKDAYLYVQAASQGMQLLGFDLSGTEEPNVTSPEIVWQLAARVKNSAKQLELEAGMRVEFSKVFTIGAGLFPKDPNAGPLVPRYGPDKFIKGNGGTTAQEILNVAVSSGNLTFDLDANDFKGYSRLRLKSVGLQLGINLGLWGLTPEQKEMQEETLRRMLPIRMDCTVTAPQLAGDPLGFRPQILLTDVGSCTDNAISGEMGPNVECRAVTGEWKINLGWKESVGIGSYRNAVARVNVGFGQLMRQSGVDYSSRAGDGLVFLQTVVLHLRLTGIPDPPS